MLEKRDEGRTDRHHLAGRDVDVVHLVGGHQVDVTVAHAHQHAILGELALVVHRGVGLGDDEAVLLIGGQVVDVVGDQALVHLAVRGLDETEGIDPGEGCQRTDQADVRALRGLDGAHAAVVAGVHISHFHAGAVARQATGAHGREATLVRQLGERVVLVHELRELAGAEELLERRGDRTHIDQGLGRDGLDVLGGHAITHDALHAAQAGTQLVLDQLAHRAHPAIAEVVDVIGLDGEAISQLGLALVQRTDVVDRGHDVVHREHLLVVGQAQAELLVDLVAANLGGVIALRVEVEVVQQRLGSIARRGSPDAACGRCRAGPRPGW